MSDSNEAKKPWHHHSYGGMSEFIGEGELGGLTGPHRKVDRRGSSCSAARWGHHRLPAHLFNYQGVLAGGQLQ